MIDPLLPLTNPDWLRMGDTSGGKICHGAHLGGYLPSMHRAESEIVPMSEMTTSTCIPYVNARYSAVAIAMRGVIKHSPNGSFVR